jgi:hypothetical protein
MLVVLHEGYGHPTRKIAFYFPGVQHPHNCPLEIFAGDHLASGMNIVETDTFKLYIQMYKTGFTVIFE